MMLFVIVLHVIVCMLLIAIVLVQQGRGGGLIDTFSSVETMFGPKTSAFLTRATSVLAVTFFVTCLTLAFMSARQSRSLLKDIKPVAAPVQVPVQQAPVVPATPPAAAPVQAPAK